MSETDRDGPQRVARRAPRVRRARGVAGVPDLDAAPDGPRRRHRPDPARRPRRGPGERHDGRDRRARCGAHDVGGRASRGLRQRGPARPSRTGARRSSFGPWTPRRPRSSRSATGRRRRRIVERTPAGGLDFQVVTIGGLPQDKAARAPARDVRRRASSTTPRPPPTSRTRSSRRRSRSSTRARSPGRGAAAPRRSTPPSTRAGGSSGSCSSCSRS